MSYQSHDFSELSWPTLLKSCFFHDFFMIFTSSRPVKHHDQSKYNRDISTLCVRQVDSHNSLLISYFAGRGKMKKTMGMFMMAAMMKAMMMIPMSIGILFILAGKALIISKIALVLSLLITLKKLLSKPTEHVVHESHGWNPSGGSGGWDKRSYRPPVPENGYNQNVHAQNLAYNSYVNH